VNAIRLALLAAAALCCACGPAVPKYDYAKEPDPRVSEYVFGVADQLSIRIWQNNELTTDAVIRPDGNITLPLVGDVRAVGETVSSLKAKIHKALSDYGKFPLSEITISVTGFNSYRFTVSGEVVRPGVFSQTGYATVAEAIAQAGGFTRFAKRNEMVLMRRDPKTGQTRTIPLVYDLLASGKRPDMNIVLITGDSLFVP